MSTYYRLLTPAFTIYAYTLDGEIYCPECSSTGDASINGQPVFASDAYVFRGMTCGSCRETIEGLKTIEGLSS